MLKTADNKKYFSYNIALICWILYTMIYGATTINISSTVGNIWYLICIVLLLYNVMKVRAIRRKQIYGLGVMLLVILSIIVAYQSNYIALVGWALMVIASIEIDQRHIVLVYFKVYLFISILIPLLSIANIIPNVVKNTVGGTGQRVSLGFTHPNVLAACFLVLVMCWCYLNWSRMRLYHVIILNLIAYLVMLITDSDAVFICIIFISWVAILERWLDRKGKIKIWYCVTIILLISFPVLSYYLMVNYSPADANMLAVDIFTTGRIRCMNAFYNFYGWNLFGQDIVFNLDVWSENLFALDNSYVYLLIQFGLVITLVYYIGIAREIVAAVKSRDNFLIICIMTFMIYGFFENYFFKTQFNFTLLFIASACFKKKEAPQQPVPLK